MTTKVPVASWSSRHCEALSPHAAGEMVFLSVFRLASAIEGDVSRACEWYRSAGIRELGGLTARELVRQGHVDRVIGFLLAVGRGERG